MLFPTFISTDNNAAVSVQNNVDVNVEVTLGEPRHKSRFFGICKLAKYIGSAEATTGCNADDNLSRAGKMRVDLQKGFALLSLRNGQMSPELGRRHFGREGLQIWEPIPLSNFLGQGQGLGKYLLPGVYQLTRHKNTYALRLRLGEADPGHNELIWNIQKR